MMTILIGNNAKMRLEELLARDGKLVYKTRGVSMEPMLRQNRNLVTISVPSSRLKKYDVALYRRQEALSAKESSTRLLTGVINSMSVSGI